MIKRSTWVLLGIFIVLLAVTLLLPRFKGSEPEVTPVPTSTPTLESPISFSVSDIAMFYIESSEGKVVEVDRSEDGIWTLIQPDEELSESNNIEGVVASVVNLNLLSVIEPAPPADVSGLEFPLYTVTLVDFSGQEEYLLIGNLTPTSSGYYVTTNDGIVYVAQKAKIDLVIDFVENPPIVVTPTPTISETELVNPTDSGSSTSSSDVVEMTPTP